MGRADLDVPPLKDGVRGDVRVQVEIEEVALGQGGKNEVQVSRLFPADVSANVDPPRRGETWDDCCDSRLAIRNSLTGPRQVFPANESNRA